MRKMSPSLSASLSKRRALSALLVSGLTALLLGGAVIGLAMAEGPAKDSPAPASLEVAAPHVGDRATYTKQSMTRSGEGAFEPKGSVEDVFTFEWIGDHLLRDVSGNVVVAYELNLTYAGRDGSYYNLYDAANGGLVAQTGGCSASIGGGGERATDALFETQESKSEWARCLDYPREVDRPFEEAAAPCGLFSLLQGNEVSLETSLALHLGCSDLDRRAVPACIRYVAEASETWGERQVVRFATVNHGGDRSVEACDRRANAKHYLWYAEDVPYPLQMAIEGWYEPDELTVFRLDAFTRGATPMRAANDVEDATPLPAVEYKPRQPWGMDDSDLDHPFKASDAFRLARDDPDDASLRDFLAEHPDAFPMSTMYDEEDEDTGTRIDRTWWIILQDHDAFLSFQVHQSVRPLQDAVPGGWFLPTLPQQQTTYSFDYTGSVAAPSIDPADVPEMWPTADSLMRRWSAWTGLLLNDLPPNMYGVRVAKHDPTTLELEAGRSMVESNRAAPAFIDPSYSRNLTLSSLVFDGTGRAISIFEANSAWARTTAVPGQGGSVPDDRLAAAALEFEPVAFAPGRAIAVGVGAIAVTAGLLYLIWPTLKSLVAAPLFSRVERPQALKNDSRARIVDLVRGSPGIQQSELRRATGLAPGALQHHMRILLNVGLVTARVTSGHTSYFPAGGLDRRVMDALAQVKAEGAWSVLRLAKERPDLSGAEMAACTGLTPQAVSQHLARLANAGLVSTTRRGRAMCIRATDLGRSTLAARA